MDPVLAETAKTFIHAFATLSAEAHLSVRTPDCIHQFAPASVGISEPKDNDAFAAHFKGLKEVLAGFPVMIKEMFVATQERTVTVWATSETIFHPELRDDGIPAEQWRYQGEYLFILSMDETGRKIKRIVEFLDSKKTDELRGLMSRARETRRKLSGQS